MRLHRKVWLWHGSWWAVQLYIAPYFSTPALHVDFRFAQWYVDFHCIWLIASIGKRCVITNAVDRYRHTCRGMLFEGPVL